MAGILIRDGIEFLEMIFKLAVCSDSLEAIKARVEFCVERGFRDGVQSLCVILNSDDEPSEKVHQNAEAKNEWNRPES